ncbi:MAG: hypothetical protein WCK49_09400 [Myxococcaceae bacterium]
MMIYRKILKYFIFCFLLPQMHAFCWEWPWVEKHTSHEKHSYKMRVVIIDKTPSPRKAELGPMEVLIYDEAEGIGKEPLTNSYKLFPGNFLDTTFKSNWELSNGKCFFSVYIRIPTTHYENTVCVSYNLLMNIPNDWYRIWYSLGENITVDNENKVITLRYIYPAPSQQPDWEQELKTIKQEGYTAVYPEMNPEKMFGAIRKNLQVYFPL